MWFRMWLIPIGTLLQCEHMPSHQEALAKGMLVQYTSEIAGRVIFGEWHNVFSLVLIDAGAVSHEWLSLSHAGEYFLDRGTLAKSHFDVFR